GPLVTPTVRVDARVGEWLSVDRRGRPFGQAFWLAEPFRILWERRMMAIRRLEAKVIQVSRSLWLPVSRQNFYNHTESDWLESKMDGPTIMVVRSNRLEMTEPNGQPYVPLLLVAALRRLLEVLPRSFGYSPSGRCEVRGDSSSRQRPV